MHVNEIYVIWFLNIVDHWFKQEKRGKGACYLWILQLNKCYVSTNFHRNRRYFVIKLHIRFCLSYFLKTNINFYCINQYFMSINSFFNTVSISRYSRVILKTIIFWNLVLWWIWQKIIINYAHLLDIEIKMFDLMAEKNLSLSLSLSPKIKNT
jgi:hypothetical protein